MQPCAYVCSGVFVLEQHMDNANPSVIQSVCCLGVSCFQCIVNRMDMKNIILSCIIFTLTLSSSIACLYKISLTIVY